MPDIVTDVDMTELALRAKDQEIANLRKELRDAKLDHSREVHDLHEEIQNLLNQYEQSATVDRHGSHEQLQDDEMEDEYPREMEVERRIGTGNVLPSISHEPMNQQIHQAYHGAGPSMDSALQAGQESYAQIGVDSAPNEFDRRARPGVHNLQASVENTPPASQESTVQRIDLRPDMTSQMSTFRGFDHSALTHAEMGIAIPEGEYRTSKYLQADGLSPSVLESFMESTLGLAYDPFWYRHIGIKATNPKLPKSARKLTDFFKKVFQIGDQFWVRLELDGQWTQRCATVKSLARFGILFIEPSRYGSYGVDCELGASIRLLYNAILREHTGTISAEYVRAAGYDDINVYRQGVYLGNLTAIRKWHQLWTDDFDLWAIKTGRFHLRNRRSVPPMSSGGR